MKAIKLISVLLAVLMLVGSLAILVSAEGETSDLPTYSTKTGNGISLMAQDSDGNYLYKQGKYYPDPNNKTVVKVVTTPEEKLALMDYRYGVGDYELYVDAYSGEVALRCRTTNETLFTNPYDIGTSKASDATGSKAKDELLSQIIVYYELDSEAGSGSSVKPMTSYEWATTRNQIKVKNIKGGIRVEYTLGREENRTLLPRQVEASVMENIFKTIQENMEAAIASGEIDPAKVEDERHRYTQFYSYYSRISLDDAINKNTGETDPVLYAQLTSQYPVLKEFEELAKTDPQYEHFAIYVTDETLKGEVLIKKQEALIKEYCKDYTFEQLEIDHAYAKYVEETEVYPLFKLALEYTLEVDENNGEVGLMVRLPANGIRFDETLFNLVSIDILPYMGAGKNPNKGYTFFPDGSGTLFSFEDIAIKNSRTQIKSSIYGADFAYHNITGNYEEVIRYPVFGVCETQQISETETKDRGFVAIIEEGESMVDLTTYHGGETSEYNTVIMSVKPRPKDSYNLADAISVANNATWTVVSTRKYTGSYTVRYMLLTDKDVAAEKGLNKFYETSYVGMAKAYRERLLSKGQLIPLDESKIDPENIPLYIETFGAVETTERFLSVPINVMTPLTSFSDIKKMYDQLSAEAVGITNVNFIMTGYTDGGMLGKAVPYNLKWENAVSKDMSFKELTEDARGKYGLYPDFDFVFSTEDKLFDGLWLDSHAAKTIDDRYTSKREYSATKHTYVSYYELALSPAYFSHFYEKFVPKYKEYSPIGISVSTLGSYLNSDFDEDEPYNRADSQEFTVGAFDYINANLPDTKVLTTGGNSYCWKFVDHITDVALDSSRFSVSSASVPFLGIVLHGYVQIAGTPINMEGNMDYAFLKAMESGAALKFILSYRNTSKLKEFETLSKYYSVNYDIWFNNGDGDLVKLYKKLNKELKDVQLSPIKSHEFINDTAVRVPDADELELDAKQAIKDAIAYEEALANARNEEQRRVIFDARQMIVKGSEAINSAVSSNEADALKLKVEALQAIYNDVTDSGTYRELATATQNALDAYAAYQQMHGILTEGSSASIEIDSILSAKENAEKNPEDADKQKSWETSYELAVQYLGLGDKAKTDAILADAKAVKDAKAALDAAEEGADTTALTAAYEAAKAKFDAYGTLGKVISEADAIKAMDDLKDAKEAYEKNKSDVALKAAFEEARKNAYGYYVEVSADGKTSTSKIAEGSLLDGVSAQIKFTSVYGEEYIGGTRGFRASSKAVFKQNSEDLDAMLETVYDMADDILDNAYEEIAKYEYSIDEIKAAYESLEAAGVFSTDERARLAAMVNKIEAVRNEYEVVKGYYNVVINIVKESYNVYDKVASDYVYHKVADSVSGTHYEIYESDVLKLFNATGYEFVEKVVEEDNKITVEKPVPNTQKYKTDANMIVHQTFENGVEFILNFNDYSVVVVIDGIMYQLEGYGYIVLNPNA